MIRKIQSLTSIGKYRSYVAAGQVGFKALTTVFGDNGSGKTTLTSIIRSLAINKPEIILSRKSTNTGQNQAGQIIIRTGTTDTHHTFHHTNGWTAPLSNVEIFDVHFINENIYSGFDFNDDHKKHLHQFVVGAQGVAIKQQIEQNKLDKTSSRQNQQQIKQDLIDLIQNGLVAGNLQQFLNIPQENTQNIVPQIQTAQIELTNANAQSLINNLRIPSKLSLLNLRYNFTSLKEVLQTTVETIQSQVLQELFSTHCTDLTENNLSQPETWIKQGFNYTLNQKNKIEAGSLNDLSCPYCQQTINQNLQILSSYTQKFNEQFKILSDQTTQHLQDVSALNIDLLKQIIKNVSDTNITIFQEWVTHLPENTVQPSIELEVDFTTIATTKTAIQSDLQGALQDPTQLVSTSNVEELERLITVSNQKITEYNQRIDGYITAINSFKQGIPSISLATEKVNNLIRIKKRYEPAIITKVGELNQEKLNLTTLDQQYTTLLQQQESTANTFFTTYCTRINYYLDTVFKTPFQITNVVNIAPQGRATQSKIGYTLTFDNQPISFSEDAQYSVKQCLSEGDKSTIALSFFLAKLDIDPNRQDKILVFDDPLSSLDTKRRAYTISIIRSFVSDIKQVIVLSHIEHFLYEIQKNIGNGLKANLRIEENYMTKESKIAECDLEDLVKNEYFKNIEDLERFRQSPNHSIKISVLGWLRNVLESHLKFKFYKEIRAMTGMKTFGNMVSFLSTSNVVFKNNTNRPDTINRLNIINDMSWKAHHGTPTPSYSSLGYDPNSITAVELDNLIQDTLDLIENVL